MPSFPFFCSSVSIFLHLRSTKIHKPSDIIQNSITIIPIEIEFISAMFIYILITSFAWIDSVNQKQLWIDICLIGQTFRFNGKCYWLYYKATEQKNSLQAEFFSILWCDAQLKFLLPTDSIIGFHCSIMIALTRITVESKMFKVAVKLRV